VATTVGMAAARPFDGGSEHRAAAAAAAADRRARPLRDRPLLGHPHQIANSDADLDPVSGPIESQHRCGCDAVG